MQRPKAAGKKQAKTDHRKDIHVFQLMLEALILVAWILAESEHRHRLA